MILEIPPKLTLEIINKDLEIFKAFFKKGFEIRLCNRSGTFVAMMVMSSSKANDSKQKCG